MKRRIWSAALAVSVMAASAQASGVEAAPLYAFDKSGATPNQVIADMQTCADRASHVPLNAAPVVGPSLIGGLVAGVVVGVYEGVQRAHAMTAAADGCMYGLGYTRLDLTPEEDASFRAARSREAKQAWVRAFVDKDLSSRIAAAAPSQPKMLPQLGPEPFAFAGVRIDPATLKVVSGPTPNYRPLLTATVSHRRIAILEQDVQAERPIHLSMAAGAVLYGVDGAGLSSPEQTTLWCGPAVSRFFGRERTGTACLLSTEAGLALLPGGAVPWMMSPEQLPSQVRPEAVTSGWANVVPADGDRLGAMDLVLEALTIEPDRVRLRATVQRAGEKTPIWTGDVAFGPDGRAVLPFWSKWLILKRTYDKDGDRYLVEPSLQGGGPGAGWLDASPPATVAGASAVPTGG